MEEHFGRRVSLLEFDFKAQNVVLTYAEEIIGNDRERPSQNTFFAYSHVPGFQRRNGKGEKRWVHSHSVEKISV
jgi:hypothetical protein